MTQLEFEWLATDTSERGTFRDEPLGHVAYSTLHNSNSPDLSPQAIAQSSPQITPQTSPQTLQKLATPEPPIPHEDVDLPLDVSNPDLLDSPNPDVSPHQTQRILQLEQALDQCQSYINELKIQLVELQFLEEVLAKTEEAAHIQQQAINSLKQQLQQQVSQETKLLELESANTVMKSSLANAEALNQSYRLEVVHLQTHLQQERDAHQLTQQHFTHQLAELQLQLEHKKSEELRLQTQLAQTEELNQQRTEQLTLLKSRSQQLEADLRNQQQNLNLAEANLQRTKEILISQQDVLGTLQQGNGSDSSKNTVIQKMSKSLLQSQNKIEALESEVVAYRLAQAKLQHYSHEWEEKSELSQKRTSQLERQVAEMQEQILQQAQQARELETAVQHWKTRGQSSEQHVAQLREILEHLLTDRSLADLELALSGSSAEHWQAAAESAQLLNTLKVALTSLVQPS
jgi:chromosome segregation ATPase